MDDYEPWLTPCDPDFDPEKCESAYALWAVKEEGEPVKFLEASITDNLDYPSGYWFFWRTISFSEETGRLIEGEWGGAGDICRADYVADMVLPGGAVFARVQGELDDGIPFDWEVRRPLDDCAKTRAAEAIRAGILALPLSASASIEAIPSPYKIDVSIVHGGTLTHDMARNLLVSAEHYYRDSALCGLLDNWNGLAVAQRALLVQAAKSMREDSPDEAFASLSRAIALIRAPNVRAAPCPTTRSRTTSSSRGSRRWSATTPSSSRARSPRAALTSARSRGPLSARWGVKRAPRSMPRSKASMPDATAATSMRSYSPMTISTTMPT